ncbi:hypothetical protein [Halococcus thailandensis]|uniref:Uncharacterized protein n=1 Tax=Halococcus thailandensis JCM 13552 TaxID=1227457 RepID=M0NGT5_9EURY|nr:hypothetical protein [Halococcus thailandensis]EMA56778.1 hypothetical protein C451_00595 [Halococcus thailandensis JCM 13552]
MSDSKPSRQTKYEIPDDHVWADEQVQESEDRPPVAEVEHHAVEILHRGRDRTDGERDIRYRYVFENGEAIGILRSHRLAESNQFDPMGAIAPYEVPAIVKDMLAHEMLADHWTEVVDVEQAERFAKAIGRSRESHSSIGSSFP